MNDLLKSLAPTVLSAVLGPFSGIALSALGSILGVSSATTESVTKAFQDGKLTPEQLSAIKELELKYQNDEKERGFKYAELEFKNTDSARSMQTATRSSFPAWLSSGITLGFFGILGWMLYDDNIINSQPILIMLGSLGAAFGAVVNFWLGSNSGSERTKELLAQAQPIPAK